MAKDNIVYSLSKSAKNNALNYFVCGLCTVYCSSNGSSWKPYLSFKDTSTIVPASLMSCYALADMHTMFAFGKNANGEKTVFYTEYAYDIIDDNTEYTALSALMTYEDNKSIIDQ
jgi:hypothetical protein